MSFLRRSHLACSGSVLTERRLNFQSTWKPVSASVFLSCVFFSESSSLVLPLLVPHVRFHTSVIAHSLHLCLIDSLPLCLQAPGCPRWFVCTLLVPMFFFIVLLVLLLLIRLQPIWICLHVLDRRPGFNSKNNLIHKHEFIPGTLLS